MTDNDATAAADEQHPPDPIRVQDFDTSAPIELDIGNTIGPVDIELTDTAITSIEVRHDPTSGYLDWRGGLSGLLSWVTEQFGETGFRPGRPDRPNFDWRNSDAWRERSRVPREPIADAVRETRIDLTGSRLVVRTPDSVPLRTVPLSIKVVAPGGSQVGVRTGAGAVRITGTAGRLQVQSGAGAVSADRVSGAATVRTGSGQLRLGGMGSGVQARSGSGDVEIASIEAPSSIVTGSGNVWLGAVSADVLVRSGSGDLTIADAVSGRSELVTGSGELQVSVHKGVHAEVDLTSSTGVARSELEVAGDPPEHDEPQLWIFARTGSGDALLSTAV
jgi:hypothetical protein